MAGARVLFVTGPGGDGTTTVAAATALATARGGERVLLLSHEPPARLAALLGTAPPAWPGRGPLPELAPNLAAAGLEPAARFRAAVLAGQRLARPALEGLGAGVLEDDELTELPGAAEAALLAALREARAGDQWDRLVVDLPPAWDAVRLLALPGQLRRYLRRLLPAERRTARALRPLLAQLAGVPLPAEGLYEAAARWEEELAGLQQLIESPQAGVRLVLDPAERSAAVLRTARSGLALHGLGTEALIANRLAPYGPGDWATALAARQESALAGLTGVAALPEPHPVPHLGREPGPGDLAALGVPPAGRPLRPEPELVDRLAAQGLLIWRLPLPGGRREELDLVRRGDELFVTTGPFRRALPLPSALRRCTVAGAAFEDSGHLAVRFAPDPGRWPERALNEGARSE